MIKRILIASVLFLQSCMIIAPVVVPATFEYKEVKTSYFTIATWQKISNKNGDIKIYIEGDGNSFTARGFPTANPTPRGGFMRNKAFSDPALNVVYMARPCQFIIGPMCKEHFWTTGRFAPEVIYSTISAVKEIAGDREIELVGFSGGAQVAGIVAVIAPELQVKRLINYAPNLDHETWTEDKRLIPLADSMSLSDYQDKYLSIDQMNYIPEEDWIIPPDVTINFLKGDKRRYTIIPDVGHNFQ